MFHIPTVTKNLLILNVLAFVACLMLGKEMVGAEEAYRLNDWLGLHFFFAPDFHIYQLFTYMFMHGSFEHLFFNMFALWMFGCVVERVWGAKKFLFYYLCCGVGAGLFQELAQLGQFYTMIASNYPDVPFGTLVKAVGPALNGWTTVGASGAIYAILLAFGMIFPEERIFIFPLPVPIKAKWFVILYAGVELFMALTTAGDGVAHLAHLGGMVFGFFMIRYWQRHPDSAYRRYAGEEFFNNLRSKWEDRTHKKVYDGEKTEPFERRESDWEYNANKKKRQEEIDRILDKIRKNGYDSLTAAEKQTLFDSSRE
ncbi:MAG TPA: rhomboid family intramembrane serine protease [Prevotella sp.]